MKILSLITHHYVIPNQKDLCLSSEHKLRYLWLNLRALWPCIDSNRTNTFKAQKGSKDIDKIVHMISVVHASMSVFDVHACGAADEGAGILT